MSFFGDVRLQAVAEPSLCAGNGIVVASIFDLAATAAKAILDSSEWKDYVDIATLLDAGLSLAEIIGYATAVFDPLFEFPAPLFVQSLAWFGDGTAGDVPPARRRQLVAAVRALDLAAIPVVRPYRATIAPWAPA